MGGSQATTEASGLGLSWAGVSCSPGLGGSAYARRHIICYGLGIKKPGNDKTRGRRGERETPLVPLFPPAPLLGGTFSVKLSLTTLQFPALLNHSVPRLGPLLQGPLVIHPLRTRAIYRSSSVPRPTHPVHIRLDKEGLSLYTCGPHLTRPFLKQGCMVCKQLSEVCTTMLIRLLSSVSCPSTKVKLPFVYTWCLTLPHPQVRAKLGEAALGALA